MVGTELEDARLEARIYERTGIPPRALDEDAVRVVRRLRRKSHETYLVGGCVRDLLLGRVPKDFDIATSARPRQVKSLFRNCRIIGRRFKLAHLHFEGKILEVSTFRQRPQPSEEDEEEGESELLIRSDNAFGNAEEDAYRRDFTINALFYEPESDMVIDYVEGIPDLQNGLIRTIGEPLIRLKEDPIRILRAIKFSSRLAFQIEPTTWDAMCEAAPDLKLGAPPRIYEELLRFLKSGFALRAFQLLRDSGALKVLLPDLSRSLEAAEPEERMRFWRILEGLDSANREELAKGAPPLPTSVCLASLILFHVEEKAKEEGGVPERLVEYGRWLQENIGGLFQDLNTPRMEVALLKKIIPLQGRFENGGEPGKVGSLIAREDEEGKKKRKKGRRRRSPKTSDAFQPALQLLRVRAIAGLVDWEVWEEWKPKEEEGRGAMGRSSKAASALSGSSKAGSSKAGSSKAGPSKAGFSQEDSTKARSGSRTEEEGSERPRRGSKREENPKQGAGNRGEGKSRKKGGGKERSKKAKTSSPRGQGARGTKRKERKRPSKEKKSYFPPLPEIELDPNQIPTYGSIVGDTTSIDKGKVPEDRARKKKKKPRIGEGDAHDETHYIPPPPPEPETGPKKPQNEPDVFGDW